MKKFFVLLLLVAISIYGSAQGTSKSIYVPVAGTLSNYISDDEKYLIEKLTLTGELNSTDFRLLRDMAGNNFLGELTEGRLAILDISGISIMPGGENYLDANVLHYKPSTVLGGQRHYSLEQPDEIGQYLFACCIKLQHVYLPESVKTIAHDSFSHCMSLTSVEIPDNVSSLGNYAFNSCTSLQKIVSRIVTPFPIMEYTFSVYETATLMVPPGTIDAYKNQDGWKNFQNIVEMEEQDDGGSDEEAFYIYRNDGQFNAFFCNEIDSIGYSHYDAEGHYYEENVAQLVYTPDSIYSIPLAVIDSVAFRVNEIKVSQNYIPVDEDSYTIISADVEAGRYVLLFNGSVPSIEEGNVMTILGDSIYEIIRVQSVQRSGQQVTLTSEKASLGDIFTNGTFTLSTEQLNGDSPEYIAPDGNRVFYPVEIIYTDENNLSQRVRCNTPHKADFEQDILKFSYDFSGHEIYKNDYIKLYLDKCRFDFDLDLIVSCNFNSFDEGLGMWWKGELMKMKAAMRGKVGADFMLRLDAHGEKKEEFPDLMLKKNFFKPDKAKFKVKGVPIVIISTLHLMTSGKYEVEGNVSVYSGFTASASGEIGLSWTRGNKKKDIKPYTHFSRDFEPHKPTIEGNAHLEEKISVFPSITFSLYGLVGPTFHLKPYQRNSLDVGFYDELLSHNERDFYGANYNENAGFDAAAGVSFVSILGTDPIVSDDYNVFELNFYEGPKKIKFEKASQDTITTNKPVDVSFKVTDLTHYPTSEVTASLPFAVKFITNSGYLKSDTLARSAFALVDTDTGLATIKWTPGSNTTDGKADYIKALIYDHEGKIISSDLWTPEKENAETGVFLDCPDNNHPHIIDLGLPSGTKWACCNVGASAPEQYGNYYAWGETQPKSVYDWSTYSHCDGSPNTCHSIGSDIAGTKYDAATANWGIPWQMPTIEQYREITNNCSSIWLTQNGVIGRKFTGPNGGTIFLPAGGYSWESGFGNVGLYGDYWSSTAYGSDLSRAWYLILGYEVLSSYYDYHRVFGRSVRPVR